MLIFCQCFKNFGPAISRFCIFEDLRHPPLQENFVYKKSTVAVVTSCLLFCPVMTSQWFLTLWRHDHCSGQLWTMRKATYRYGVVGGTLNNQSFGKSWHPDAVLKSTQFVYFCNKIWRIFNASQNFISHNVTVILVKIHHFRLITLVIKVWSRIWYCIR